MEQINNLETIKECSRVLGYQIENKPLLDTSKVVLTAEVNPKRINYPNFIMTATRTTTGDLDVLIPSSTKDVYIQGISASYIKDATCDVSTGFLTVKITPRTGTATTVYAFPVTTTTAEKDNMIFTFPNPFLVRSNSNISFLSTFTAGTLNRSMSVWGYIEDIRPNL